jgi:hypothetical protein
MLETGTVVLRSSFNILGETSVFGSTWVKPNSLSLAANSAMWLNLPLAHIVERETSNNLLPLSQASQLLLLLETCRVWSKYWLGSGVGRKILLGVV